MEHGISDAHRRLPHGRRGLKYFVDHLEPIGAKSPSSRKAGIEIFLDYFHGLAPPVAFLTEGGD